jgi:iron complex outermembrane receptor protein
VEKGILQLDQRETVSSLGEFVRAELDFGRVRTSGGLRADQISFEVRDVFTDDGRDDSGSRTLTSVSPMLGLFARLFASHSTYLNYSTAFETPTTTELGNQADGGAGFNSELQPQFSRTLEWGLKGVLRGRVLYDAALFTTSVRDELIAFEVPGGGGRTYYRNAGRTRRRGAEVGAAASIQGLELAAAYSLSTFRFSEFDVVSGGVTSSYGGNAIPGIPERQAQLTATWRARDNFIVAEWLARSSVFVNDANSASAPGFAIVNARIGSDVTAGRSRITAILGVQNLFDRRYIGSVAINAAGTPTTGKFYEPGGRQSIMAGLQIRP